MRVAGAATILILLAISACNAVKVNLAPPTPAWKAYPINVVTSPPRGGWQYMAVTIAIENVGSQVGPISVHPETWRVETADGYSQSLAVGGGSTFLQDPTTGATLRGGIWDLDVMSQIFVPPHIRVQGYYFGPVPDPLNFRVPQNSNGIRLVIDSESFPIPLDKKWQSLQFPSEGDLPEWTKIGQPIKFDETGELTVTDAKRGNGFIKVRLVWQSLTKLADTYAPMQFAMIGNDGIWRPENAWGKECLPIGYYGNSIGKIVTGPLQQTQLDACWSVPNGVTNLKLLISELRRQGNKNTLGTKSAVVSLGD